MYIAIDAGATNIRIASFESLDPKSIKEKVVLSTLSDYSKDLGQIKEEIHKLTTSVDGIGVGVASLLSDAGDLIFPNNNPTWKNQPLKRDLENEFGCRVWLANDAATAALGEALYGSEKTDSFVSITWGTGIGGSFVKFKNGKPILISSELGHHIIERDGRTCSCGQQGCLEAYCGGNFLKEIYGKNPQELSEQEWGEVEEKFALGLISLAAIFLPTRFLFSGSITLNQQKRVSNIKNLVAEKLKILPNPEFSISTLGENAALFGALSLLKEDAWI